MYTIYLHDNVTLKPGFKMTTRKGETIYICMHVDSDVATHRHTAGLCPRKIRCCPSKNNVTSVDARHLGASLSERYVDYHMDW